MPNIKAKNYHGDEVVREGVDKVWFSSADEKDTLVPYSYGEVLEDTQIQPDFSNGDMLVTLPKGTLVREATIIKPESLAPENIRRGTDICGILGEFIGDTEERTVELNMAEGDQEILPATEGKSLSKVTIIKPANLVPANIAEGVNIAGVVGTLNSTPAPVFFKILNFLS